jgi:hypothetical protein
MACRNQSCPDDIKAQMLMRSEYTRPYTIPKLVERIIRLDSPGPASLAALAAKYPEHRQEISQHPQWDAAAAAARRPKAGTAAARQETLYEQYGQQLRRGLQAPQFVALPAKQRHIILHYGQPNHLAGLVTYQQNPDRPGTAAMQDNVLTADEIEILFTRFRRVGETASPHVEALLKFSLYQKSCPATIAQQAMSIPRLAETAAESPNCPSALRAMWQLSHSGT